VSVQERPCYGLKSYLALSASFRYRHTFRDLPSLLDGSYTAVVNNAKVDNCKLLVYTDPERSQHETIYILSETTSTPYSDHIFNKQAEGIFTISGDSLDEVPMEAPLKLKTATHDIDVVVLERLSPGTAVAHLKLCGSGTATLKEAVSEEAQVPLPPYISSLDGEERYQTIFAEQPGSVAAPTASLHFTADVLQDLEKLEASRSPLS